MTSPYLLSHDFLSRPTVGFSGSGGAGKTPSPKTYFAGSRRIPSAAKPLSAANGVGQRQNVKARQSKEKNRYCKQSVS